MKLPTTTCLEISEAKHVSSYGMLHAFGEAAAWPVLSFVKKFKEDFEAKGAADEAKAKSAGPSSEMKIAANP